MTRPTVPTRKHRELAPVDFPKQFGRDVVQGSKQLADWGKAAVERVKEGVRKVKKHLGG